MSPGESRVQVVNFRQPYKEERILILLKYLSCWQGLLLRSMRCNITRAGAKANVTTYIIPEQRLSNFRTRCEIEKIRERSDSSSHCKLETL